MMKTTNFYKTAMGLLLWIATVSYSHVMGQEKVYGFGYATDHGNKIVYFTNIVEGLQKSDAYFDASNLALENQWGAKLRTVVSEQYRYKHHAVGFHGASVSSYDAVDEQRTGLIGDFKQQGFTIYYIKDFRFKNAERK